MPDLSEAQTLSKHREDAYSGITADAVYQNALASDFDRLGKGFSSLQRNHDYNGNGVLELAELQKGAVLKQHETAEIALVNGYMLRNFNELSGLANSRGEGKASGISEADINALQAISSPQRQEFFDQINDLADRRFRSRDSYLSAVVGFAGGLAVTGIACGMMKVLGGRFAVPLTATAVAAPLIGFTTGGDMGLYRNRLANDFHAHNKISVAAQLLSSENYPAVTAKTIYDDVLNQRLQRLSASATGEQDIDKNGFIDRTELELSIMSKSGDQKYNTFLSQNYDDLELLSRTLPRKDTAAGISMQAINLLTQEGARSNYFSRQHSLANQVEQETYSMAREYRLPLAVGTGALFYAGHRFVPSQYKPAYALGAAVVTAALSSAAPGIIADSAGKGNAEFLQNQSNAIDRLIHRL